jgi:hypothetical protein
MASEAFSAERDMAFRATLRRQTIFSILLLLSVVPLVFPASAIGQQFTTITTSLPYTTTQTNTATQVTFVGTTTRMSSQYWATQTVAGGYAPPCTVGLGPTVIAPVPETVHVDYSSNVLFDFYIFTSDHFLYWAFSPFNTHVCDSPLSDFSQKGTSSGSFDFTFLPDNGANSAYHNNPYQFVFIQQNEAQALVKVTVSGLIVGSASTFTLTSTVTLSSMIPSTRTETVEVPFIQAYGSWLIPIAIIAVLIVGFLVFRISSRKMKTR